MAPLWNCRRAPAPETRACRLHFRSVLCLLSSPVTPGPSLRQLRHVAPHALLAGFFAHVLQTIIRCRNRKPSQNQRRPAIRQHIGGGRTANGQDRTAAPLGRESSHVRIQTTIPSSRHGAAAPCRPTGSLRPPLPRSPVRTGRPSIGPRLPVHLSGWTPCRGAPPPGFCCACIGPIPPTLCTIRWSFVPICPALFA